MKIACLLISLPILLSACTTTSKAQLDGLLNKPISEALISFGKAPENSIDAGNGLRVYTWRWPISGTDFSTTGRVMYEVVTLWAKNDQIIRYQRQAE